MAKIYCLWMNEDSVLSKILIQVSSRDFIWSTKSADHMAYSYSGRNFFDPVWPKLMFKYAPRCNINIFIAFTISCYITSKMGKLEINTQGQLRSICLQSSLFHQALNFNSFYKVLDLINQFSQLLFWHRKNILCIKNPLVFKLFGQRVKMLKSMS